jgi:hypothetical protein
MQTGRFSVKGENCKDRLIDFMQEAFSNYYRSDILQGAIFFVEDYSAMTNSDLMFCVKLESLPLQADTCEVEIICGGGGDGLFSIALGNESRRVNSIYKRMAEYCSQLDYLVSDLLPRQ